MFKEPHFIYEKACMLKSEKAVVEWRETMKVIVIADTHIPKRAKTLPEILINELSSVDLIIHAGDWQTIDVYKELKKYANVVGVFGNVDGPDIKEAFSEKIILDIDQFKIGVVHGHGKGKTTEKRALAHFEGEELDCIIYGHSHIPSIKTVGKTMLFNPGSPTDKRRQPKYSFGLITTNGGKLNIEHKFFEK